MSIPKKSSGITAVYTQSTESIVTVFETVNYVALAAKALAQQAEMAAQQARGEAIDTILATMGEGGLEKVRTAEALMDALRKM